jgi:hypothetical protein
MATVLDLQARYDWATRSGLKILKRADPVRIICLGPAAWGPLHEESDLELCVVVERTDERNYTLSRHA